MAYHSQIHLLTNISDLRASHIQPQSESSFYKYVWSLEHLIANTQIPLMASKSDF